MLPYAGAVLRRVKRHGEGCLYAVPVTLGTSTSESDQMPGLTVREFQEGFSPWSTCLSKVSESGQAAHKQDVHRQLGRDGCLHDGIRACPSKGHWFAVDALATSDAYLRPQHPVFPVPTQSFPYLKVAT